MQSGISTGFCAWGLPYNHTCNSHCRKQNCICSCTLSLVQHENRGMLLVIFLLTNRSIFANDFSKKSPFKMPGRSISIEVRARVIGMLENGVTANQAAMQAGVHRATVFRIKSKFLQTSSVKNRPKPCRPRSTTAVQERFLRLTALTAV